MSLDWSMTLPALGAAVLSFLWQGAVIGAVAWLVLGAIPRGAPGARYATAIGSIFLSAVVFVATFALGLARPMATSSVVTADDASVLRLAESADAGAAGALWPTLAAWAWIVGVTLLGARFARQWWCARRLARTGVSEPDAAWAHVFDGLKERLGVRAEVRLLRSAIAEAPMVVGWLSPVVLVPVSAFTSLTPEQLRAVLAHELSHVSRHDHWVNAAQSVVETVLFFHPVVWWLSGVARVEREHCCDDAAVRSAESPRVFAEALARLESHRAAHARAAVAANGGPLMERIARILGTTPPASVRSSAWRTLSALVVGAGVATVGLAHASSAEPRPSDKQTIEMLRQASEAGMPAEHVRELYDALVFNGSEQQRRAQAELAAVEADIRAAVEGGHLSQGDAEAKLEQIRRHLVLQAEHAFSVDVLGLSREEAHLSMLQEHLAELVRRGEMTHEEAHKKLVEMKSGLDRRLMLGRQLNDLHQALDAKVAAGELTRNEVRERLARVERDVHAKQRIRELETKLEHLVRLGELTRAEADAKIEAYHERVVKVESVERADWAAMQGRVERAVVEGKLTEEKAAVYVEEMRARRAHEHAVEHAHEHMRAVRDHLLQLHDRIHGALKRGELSVEEASAKLRAIEIEQQAIKEEADRRAATSGL